MYTIDHRHTIMSAKARILSTVASQFILLTFLSSFVTGENQDFVRTLDRNLYGFKKEKLTHFRVYWHDIYSGSKPTAMPIVRPPSNTSATFFGSISMIDDPLTEKPRTQLEIDRKSSGVLRIGITAGSRPVDGHELRVR
ncbi:hypothetical protein OIU78_013059 [Salix suchowensis]|nr:hypothetical protein OIU78_013059 [Salix suchowensis]